jgi:hypothetical protein
MRSVALLLATSGSADNDVMRTLPATSETFNVAFKMLQMFSVHSFEEHLVDPSLLDIIRHSQIDSANRLSTCRDILPTKLNGEIIDSTCREENQQMFCNYKCNSNGSLLDITYNTEISCRCLETFAGITFNVPCGWFGLPSCINPQEPSGALIALTPERQVNDNVAKCGPLVAEKGEWTCDGNMCSLKCHHGYIASDSGHSMTARCLCSKHGACKWQLPAQCSRVNQIAHSCDQPFHLIGQYECTGYQQGDQCKLKCDQGWKKQQYGIRECVCDASGGCDWIGQIGSCTQDFGLSILDQFDSTSLLSNVKCQLPDVDIGTWRCEENAENCTLICPPGLQPNQVVDINCYCQDDYCMYNHKGRNGSTFGLTSSFETSIGFGCEETFDILEDDILNKCVNLPNVKHGEWICGKNGTCALTYVYRLCNRLVDK